MSASQSSEMEAPSSPVRGEGKSFVSHMGEEDDPKVTATPEPVEKHHPRKGKSVQPKDPNAVLQIGKIRHLKKEDGEPLWRKDIQYDFLKAVFENEDKVFTNSYDKDMPKQCFADLYIDTMSRSSKTSKVLRDKLLSDRDAAKGMAMVCLLVNIGRMNTTLNFFPEMRAQLRTYHAIPSLQARQDPHAYKQLQDAPRLKSILKGGMEDRDEPNSLVKIKQGDVPRTNPVNLLFVICQSAGKIAELHFPHGQEFHDLLMKSSFTSQSRAIAFLWIMWFYLESDFTEEGCEENPFGAGVDYGLSVANQGIPKLVPMSEKEEAKENVDTEEEIEFGLAKQKLRAEILQVDQQMLMDTHHTKRASRGARALADEGPAILPRIRPSKHESDLDSTRSTPPPARAGGRVAGSASRRGAPLRYQMFEGSSPAGPSHIDGLVQRKPRPPTAHQLAVERHRKEQINHVLDRGIRKAHQKARKNRRREGAIYRATKRIEAMPDWMAFEDSDEELDITSIAARTGVPPKELQSPFRSNGPGGLCQLKDEQDDFGEELSAYSAGLRRATRRLKRWADAPKDLGVVAPIKRKKEAPSSVNGHGDANGDVHMEDQPNSVLARPGGLEEEDDDGDRHMSGVDVSDAE